MAPYTGPMNTVRKGQAPLPLARDAFHDQFMRDFADPAFQAEAPALTRIEEIAWQAYQGGRKSPVTAPAGPGFADPTT